MLGIPLEPSGLEPGIVGSIKGCAVFEPLLSGDEGKRATTYASLLQVTGQVAPS
jgi:hypothetical protein